MLTADAVLIDSRTLIPKRIAAEYSWCSTLLSVCKVHGTDTYVVQRRMWNIVHYLRGDGEVVENLQSASFLPSKETAQSVIDFLCAEEFREKVITSLGTGVRGVCKVLKYVTQDVEDNFYYAGDDQWVAITNKVKRFEDKASAAVVGARLLPIGRTTAEPVLSWDAVTILLWIAVVSLSAKTMYELARGFMHEFLEHGLHWGTVIQYAVLFMLSTAVLMVSLMQLERGMYYVTKSSND